MNSPDDLEHWMRHALALAARGRGSVEPNPMVGAVVLDSDPDAEADEVLLKARSVRQAMARVAG